MKGSNGDYGSRESHKASENLANGIDYNTANSNSVKNVESIAIKVDAHNLPMTGEANSVTRNFKNGKLESERYYDKDGNAYLDIDYTNHGNPKRHKYVPHEHKINKKDGKFLRLEGKRINND